MHSHLSHLAYSALAPLPRLNWGIVEQHWYHPNYHPSNHSFSIPCFSLLLTLSLGLLLNIRLRAPLLRLGIIMHQPIFFLLLLIPR